MKYSILAGLFLLLLSACASKSTFQLLPSESKNSLEAKSGKGTYYWFLSHTSKLDNYTGMDYSTKASELLRLEVSKQNICNDEYRIIKESLVLPEQGNISIVVKCN